MPGVVLLVGRLLIACLFFHVAHYELLRIVFFSFMPDTDPNDPHNGPPPAAACHARATRAMRSSSVTHATRAARATRAMRFLAARAAVVWPKLLELTTYH